MHDLPPSMGGPTGAPEQPFTPRPRREATDPGTPSTGLVALLVAVVLYALVAGLQNLSPYLAEHADPVGRAPQGGETAKLFLLLDHSMPGPGLGAQAAAQYRGRDMHPADRLQAVLTRGESVGVEAALDELRGIRSFEGWAVVEGAYGPQEDPEAVADAAAMESLYASGPGALSAEARDRLADRYGWLGELALAEDGSQEREAMFADAGWAWLLIGLVLMALLVGGLGGLVMLTIAAMAYFRGSLRPRFVPPTPGGSVYLETFAAFLAAFLLVQVLGQLVAMGFGAGAKVTVAVMLMQWLVLPVIFWARCRGVGREAWRRSVGWHAPEGVGREIGAGVLGYFAGVPVFFAGVLVTLLLTLLSELVVGAPDSPPTNPIVELVSSGDVWVVVALVTMATVWAPIVEESVFRGALYRHLRGRVRAVYAALVTAFLFAFLHSYGPLATAPLIALGFNFAMIREWRGSLIGPVTAHFLHNATVMTIAIVALKAMT